MKLHQHTLLYLSAALLIIVGIWAALFYVNMLDEVYDSLDDGLINSKILIIQKALTDTTVLQRTDFGESNYAIRPVSGEINLQRTETFRDTLIYTQNESDYEPARLLTTVFADRQGRLYELRVITSMVEEDDLIEDLLFSLLVLYMAMIISIILVNNVLLRRIWRPFYALLDQLGRFRLGRDPVFEPSPSRVHEFALLNKTAVALLQENTRIYESQKQFIGNASHELQTPLAISINKLELLAEKATLEEADMVTIGEVIANLERLTRLNRSLLLISRIENKQFTADEDVELNALVDRLLDDFADLAAYRQVRLHYRADARLVVSMNPELAEALVVNLLKNALIHNVPHGEVWVVIEQNGIIIENTGIAVALSEPDIFRRFYKGSSDAASNGLGLAIARSIADLYGLQLSYTFTEQERHRMEVKMAGNSELPAI